MNEYERIRCQMKRNSTSVLTQEAVPKLLPAASATVSGKMNVGENAKKQTQKTNKKQKQEKQIKRSGG